MFPPRQVFGRVTVPAWPHVMEPVDSPSGRPNARPPLSPHAVSRDFAVQNFSPDPLVIRSMTITPPRNTGLSFRIRAHPWNVGGLRPDGTTLHVLEPGTNVDYRLTWAPSRAGVMNARLTVDTSGGPLVMEITGEAVAAS